MKIPALLILDAMLMGPVYYQVIPKLPRAGWTDEFALLLTIIVGLWLKWREAED
jgi:hypothetical protein